MCCDGELDTDSCVSAAGMEGWVAGLVFVPIGDCCLDCVVGDDCGVFWGCVCGCTLFELCDCGVAGCGGTTDCGGVCCVGVLLVLVEPMGVRCPQGSEFSGEVSAFCGSFVWCMLTGSGDASCAIG